ncbi:hypothetical protein GCM10009759_64430 [Kitasatospora saccharophila]|uniref:YopA central domain-containing protein n=1 Tax=Kitasatospora saccharophila TaxID=407973 RepID=A0ABP5JGJ4_9ACTN
MNPDKQFTSHTPLTPPHGWNAPGETVVLYEGELSGFKRGPRQGRVELTFGARPSLEWTVELREEDYWGLDNNGSEITTVDRTPAITFTANTRRNNAGWINSTHLGDQQIRLGRLVAQWVNLPLSVGNATLEERKGERTRYWRGRWSFDVDGWTVTTDERPDLSDALRTATDQLTSVLTHVVELKRTNGEDFSLAKGREVLECLRVSLSFGFGRKVVPALPIGYDTNGEIVWEQWFSPLLDRARTIGSEWLHHGSPDDCTELVTRALRAFTDPSLKGTTRLQMQMATEAVATGFVEQRILSAAPVLENLAWTKLVLGNLMSREDFKSCHAEDKLRYLLTSAGEPTSIDPAALPTLAKYATDRRIDGPTAVTRIRNRLVHPEILADDLYAHEGLATEVWRLSLHYATLMILHQIGYRGSYQRQVQLDRWAGDTQPMPWVDPATAPTTPAPLPPVRRQRPPRRRR